MAHEGPTGPVPPPARLDGVTEIRVHGVGGTGPEALLGDPAPTRVAGDRIAGFYRTSDAGGRHREAYSWGGMTSHSPVRALWMFLVPAMLANMGGWAARRWRTSGRAESDAAPTSHAFRWAARLAALSLTVASTAMTALLVVDVLAYQCGGTATCRPGGWWSGWADAWFGVERPGARLVLGAAATTLVVLVVFALALRTRRAYEAVEPPRVVDDPDDTPERRLHASRTCAAAHPGGLRHRDFWSGLRWHRYLSRLHLAACLTVVGAMLGSAAAAWGTAGRHGEAVTVGRLAVGVAAAALLAVVLLLARDTAADAAGNAVLGAAVASVLLAAVAALRLPLGPGPAGMAPGARATVNWAWGVTLLLLLVLGVQLTCAWLHRVWRRRRTPRTSRLDLFPWATPFVLDAMALVVASTVQLSVLVQVARLLPGEVVYGFGPAAGSRAPDGAVYLPLAVGSAASALSLGLVAVLVVTAVAFGVAYLVARSRDAAEVERDLRDAYARLGGPVVAQDAPAGSPDAWVCSAFEPGPGERQGHGPSAWVRGVAGMRFVGRHARSVTWSFVAMIGTAVVVVVLFLVHVWVLRRGAPVLPEIGTTIAVLLPPVYVAVLVALWRRERWRKALGSLFDVGTFFPRAFHPFAPPAYAERAVPELTRRIWRLHDNGGRVVLTAHSQGSVLAAATLVRASARSSTEPAIGFVGVGSPLGKLYRWAFPGLFSDGVLARLADGNRRGDGDVAGIGPVRWTNVFYRTDYVGGPVRTRESSVGGHVDVPLVDPPTHRYVAGQPLPRVLTHTGYWQDGAFWNRVDAMCAEVGAGLDPGRSPRVDVPAADPTAPRRYR
ncbi:hypothetical protein [Cellulomonas telluris]|uniref:hypothetical protein n=1 Tax=Cellulomonas telluris TaxID=2306636 RepID=UPI0010A8FF07|nr:hypothetical protein [Cellulomonas telluris]